MYLIRSPEFKPLIASTTSGAVARKILKQHFELTTTDCVIQQFDDFFSVHYVSGGKTVSLQSETRYQTTS